MVNLITFVCVPFAFMTTAVMAQSSASASQATAELEASASAALADMAMQAEIPPNVILEKMEKLDKYKAADFDDLGDFVTNVLYPLGFGQLRDTLLNVSSNLAYILDLNTKNGVQCSTANRDIINNATSCKSADDFSGFVNSVLWPFAIKGFRDTAEKINAQASCLKKNIDWPIKHLILLRSLNTIKPFIHTSNLLVHLKAIIHCMYLVVCLYHL